MASPDQISLSEGKSMVAIKLSDLAKNIDIDGNGNIDEDEKKILDTLREMDVDGDGNISLKELVNLGKKLNVADAQSKTYKKIIFFLLFFAIAAIAATFLACLGAVEAAKDSRPDSGGTLLTTSITGKTKVVQTQKHINTVAITDLYMQTYATLDGVKNMGFQVGASFYAYTVTGFQQDLAADGTSSVRFYTSRGDTIYVSKTAATLEMKAGGTVDISAASTLTRHLLSTRDLLDDMGDNMLMPGGSASSEGGYDDPMDNATVAAINLATAGMNASMSSYPANADKILSTECNRVGAHPYFTEPDEFGCKCNPGFSGAITTVFTDSTVNASGSCVQAPQPALSSCWMNSWWKSEGEGDVEFEFYSKATECYCPSNTHQGKLEWNSTTGMWSGACVVRPGVPKAYMSPEKEFVIKSTSKPTDPVSGLVSENFRHLCPATYGNGHANWQADEDSNGNPTGTGQWDSQMCEPMGCPGDSIKDNSTSPATCKCRAAYYGDGFAWQEGSMQNDWNGFWKPVDAAYTLEMEHMVCKRKTDTQQCPVNSHFDEMTGTCKCESPYTGSYAWNTTATAWSGACTAAPCPANSQVMWQLDSVGVSHPHCECAVGFTASSDGLWFDWNTTAWKGTCAALASCPINSMKSSVPMSMDCVCAPEYNGYVDYYGHNNTYVSTCTRLVCDLATQQMKTEYNAGHYHSYCECQTGKTQTWSAGTNSPTMTCA